MRHPFNLRREQYLDARQIVGNPSDDPALIRLAREYNAHMGLPPLRETPYFRLNQNLEAAVAEAYNEADSCPACDLEREAWGCLVAECDAQFELLVRDGLHVEYYGTPGEHKEDESPYADSTDMIEDVRRNFHLWVWEGGHPAPLLSQEANTRFRAVHDVFGHAAHGLSFGWRGEVNAWSQHWKMFTPLARVALTTETRAQVDWVFAGPYAPEAERGDFHFPEQKAAVLAPRFQIVPALARAYSDWPQFLEL